MDLSQGDQMKLLDLTTAIIEILKQGSQLIRQKVVYKGYLEAN